MKRVFAKSLYKTDNFMLQVVHKFDSKLKLAAINFPVISAHLHCTSIINN